MTPQERDLVNGLLERLANAPPQQKDPEAEGLIRAALQRNPDAAYLLVQSVLIQDFALQEAQKRITTLEAEAAAPARPQGNTASFLPQGPWSNRATPAPQVPQAAAPMGSPTGAPPARGGWGGAVPPAGPQAYGQPQAFGQPPQQGPSFLRQAATMAAGVAGGALLFQGIQSLFSGHSMLGGVANAAGMPGEVINETVNNYYGDQPPVPEERPDFANQADQGNQWGDQGGGADQGYQDAGYDDQGGGDFGGDFGDDSGYA